MFYINLIMFKIFYIMLDEKKRFVKSVHYIKKDNCLSRISDIELIMDKIFSYIPIQYLFDISVQYYMWNDILKNQKFFFDRRKELNNLIMNINKKMLLRYEIDKFIKSNELPNNYDINNLENDIEKFNMSINIFNEMMKEYYDNNKSLRKFVKKNGLQHISKTLNDHIKYLQSILT